MQRRELDLGCGRNKHPGAVSLDMNPGVNPDIIFEFKNRDLLPFENDSFDKIWMIDFIEHVGDIEWLLSEVHRVGKPNAEVQIKYPHYSGRNSYSDLTHVHHLGINIFDHYDPSTRNGKRYSYYTKFDRNFPYEIKDTKLLFSHPGIKHVSGLLSRLTGKKIYEAYLSGIFPISDVETILRIIKN